MKRKIIAGNWKMNKNPIEAAHFLKEFIPLVKDSKNEIILCAPYLDLLGLAQFAKETNVKIGAQNVHFEKNGAFTGEISAEMLNFIGIDYVIIGHSERRQYFNETDETINKKIKISIENELTAIVCVGETLEQRDNGETNKIITTQTKLALNELSNIQLENIIMAYEPIWAIGTGKTATAEDANNAIIAIRKEIEKNYGSNISDNICILYGGSVKSSNAKELFNMSDIDGGLVGGSSLEVEEFSKIIQFDK